MNCLSRFLQFFKPNFPKTKGLNLVIEPEEPVSRFIFESNKFKPKKNRVSPQAFDPPPNNRTSIYRVSNCTNNEIWQLSDDFVTQQRKDKKMAKARGDIFVEDIIKLKLKVVSDTSPHPRHANIVDWPSEKAEKLLILNELADKATLVIRDT